MPTMQGTKGHVPHLRFFRGALSFTMMNLRVADEAVALGTGFVWCKNEDKII